MTKVLFLVVLATLGFLCFSGPDGFMRHKDRH